MKILKLRFKDSGEEYYFSRVKGIYEKFTQEQIGVVIGSIWNQFSRKGYYESSKIRIDAYHLHQQKRK